MKRLISIAAAMSAGLLPAAALAQSTGTYPDTNVIPVTVWGWILAVAGVLAWLGAMFSMNAVQQRRR